MPIRARRAQSFGDILILFPTNQPTLPPSRVHPITFLNDSLRPVCLASLRQAHVFPNKFSTLFRSIRSSSRADFYGNDFTEVPPCSFLPIIPSNPFSSKMYPGTFCFPSPHPVPKFLFFPQISPPFPLNSYLRCPYPCPVFFFFFFSLPRNADLALLSTEVQIFNLLSPQSNPIFTFRLLSGDKR